MAHIPFTPHPPVIDGEAEALWEAAPAYTMTHLIRGHVDNAADLSGEFRALYDHDNLYVLYTIHDDRILPQPGGDPWQDDSVELYLDGSNEKYVYDEHVEQYIFTPGKSDAWSKAGRDRGVVVGTSITATGYQVEVQVPWANIGIVPQPGQLIGFDAHVNDDDNGDLRDAKLSWHAEMDKAWTNPALFGEAILELR
jgi:hypothetical protein